MVLVSYCCAKATPVRLCATFEGNKIEYVHSRHLALRKKKKSTCFSFTEVRG